MLKMSNSAYFLHFSVGGISPPSPPAYTTEYSTITVKVDTKYISYYYFTQTNKILLLFETGALFMNFFIKRAPVREAHLGKIAGLSH